jgi:hypothetical protein
MGDWPPACSRRGCCSLGRWAMGDKALRPLASALLLDAAVGDG